MITPVILTASAAMAYAKTHATPIAVEDNGGNIASNLSVLLALGSKLVSVQDTSSINPFYWPISVAEVLALGPKMTDGWGNPDTFNNIIGSAAHIAANASKLLALGERITTGGIHVSDSVANIVANATVLATLGSELALTVIDSAIAINANQAVLLSLAHTFGGGFKGFTLPDGSNISIQSSDGASLTLTAANAVAFVAEGLTAPLHIVDTGSNFASYLDALAAMGGQLLSVQDTDGQWYWNGWESYYGPVPIGTAISVADVLALAPKMVDFQGDPAQFTTILDTAANINANLVAILSVKGLQTFVLPDGISISIQSYDGVSLTLTAANAVAFIAEGLTAPLHIVDTGSDIASYLDTLATMGGQLLSVQDTDSQQYWNGWGYNNGPIPFGSAISVADVLALAPKMVDFQGNPEQFTNIFDTAANINANQAALLSLGNALCGFTLPDGSRIGIESSDGVSLTLTATNAVSLVAEGLTMPMHIVDTGSDIAGYLDTLAAMGGQLLLVQDTDTQQYWDGWNYYNQPIPFGSAISVADVLALAPKTVDFQGNPEQFTNIIDSTAVVAANVVQLLALGGQIPVGAIHVTDSAANVAANASALATLGSELTLTVTDSAANINANQSAILSVGGLKAFVLPDGTSISIQSSDGALLTLTAASAVALVAEGLTAPLHIVDTGGNIAGCNLDALVAMGGQLLSVQDTDGQWYWNGWESYYSPIPFGSPISVADALALAPKTVDFLGNPEQFTHIVDSAADVAAHAAQLLALGVQIPVGAVHVIDSAANVVANATALATLGNEVNVSVTDNAANIVANATALTTLGSELTLTLNVSDRAANIQANLDSLQVVAGQIGSLTLTLTNAGIPRLAITAAQLSGDAAVLDLIVGAYTLAVSDVAVSNLTSVFANLQVQAVSVSDSASKIQAALNTLQADYAKISSISLTNSGTPALTMFASHFLADARTLGKIVTPYSIALADKGTPTLSIAASQFAIDAPAMSKIITPYNLALSDNGIIALTASQYSQDGAVLGKLSSAYSISISGELVANVATDVKNSHVTAIGITDTVAHISAGLSSLASNLGKLSGIALTDSGIPTLSLAATQVTSTLGVLNAITTPYLLSVKDTVANLNKLALGGVHDSLIEIMPTLILATLTENTQVADLNLSQIKLTGDSITEKAYQGTGTEVDIVGSNNTVLHQLFFTHDSEAQLHLLGIGSTVVHVM